MGKMESQYKLRLEKIEGALRLTLPETPDSKWLEKIFELPADNINPQLIKSLTYPGWDLVNRGGKRWRPLLMLLITEALAGENAADAALPLTPLVELAHNASLIHDDIEDNSDERRGKPAIHKIYGNDTAINSGAFLYFLAPACLGQTGFSEQTKKIILETWGLFLRRLHLGQAMDIAWHTDFHSLPELPEYERMCPLKTGFLARLAAELAVICARDSIPKKNLNRIPGDEKPGNAAEKLGVGFQILDDVKNLITGAPGKKRGDDIIEGKKSLPVLLYLHRYPEKREFAASCFNAAKLDGNSPKIEEIITALDKSGILKEAKERGMEFIKESREVFTEMFTGNELLGGLIDFIST